MNDNKNGLGMAMKRSERGEKGRQLMSAKPFENPDKRHFYSKYAAIFFLCWFVLLVFLVDGVLKFQTLVDFFGSYALVKVTLLFLVGFPTWGVYKCTKEHKSEVNKQINRNIVMNLIKIQSSKDPLIAQVPELYESAFPEAERTATERFLWM
ncbi:MAG: hypothetical protein K6E73_09755, partial [Bacteroidales bacterium]|nr:hypothetical protein [Bacteroidales bacterium]